MCSWPVLQIAELLRTADDLLLPRLAALHRVTPELDDADDVVVGIDEVAELRLLADALAELAGRLQTLAEPLPEMELEVAYDDLADAAAADLGRGIIDPARALLAARVLEVGPGWEALARALRRGDTHAAWGQLTIGALLGRFRGVDERLLHRVLAVAQVDPAAPLACCDEDAVARLAAALEEHAPVEGR